MTKLLTLALSKGLVVKFIPDETHVGIFVSRVHSENSMGRQFQLHAIVERGIEARLLQVLKDSCVFNSGELDVYLYPV